MSGNGEGPGRASVNGLGWLARVGPAPPDAWACAMGWSRASAFSHAQRLEAGGWLVRCRTVWGHGSLLIATRQGVELAGVGVTAACVPAPTWWAHLQACAWTAAWLTARGREIQGSREVLADPSWSGKLRWRDRRGHHVVGHRPDLAWLVDGQRVAIEVELARKSTRRLEAIIALHAKWRSEGRTAGLIYVCVDAPLGARVRELAIGQGLNTSKGGGLRIETLAEVRQQALDAHQRRTAAAAGGQGDRSIA
jgi:hypothetical protein